VKREPVAVSRIVLAGAACALFCAVIVRAVLSRIASHYVPFVYSRLSPIVYVHYHLPSISSDWHTVVAALVLWSGAVLAILTAIAHTNRTRGVVSIALAAQAVMLALFVTTPVPIDSDQFAYVGYGDAVLQTQNPYKPSALRPSATLAQERAAEIWGNPIVPDRYGPLWTLTNAAFLWPFRHDSLETQTLALRVLAALAAIASTLLIAIVAKGRTRELAVAGFGLSPLVIIEAGAGAHNDVYMLFFALAAILAIRRNHLLLAALFLGASIAIKFAYAPLAIPFLAYVYRRSGRLGATLMAAAAAAAPTVFCALIFGIRSSLLLPLFAARSGGSVIAHLSALHRLGATAIDAVLIAGIGVAMLVASRQILQHRPPFASLAALIVPIWLLADKIEPWYALLVSPLLLMPGYGGIAIVFGITSGSLLMLSGAFQDRYPSGATIALAIALSLIAYAFLRRNGRAPASVRRRVKTPNAPA
jgi:hypothetical protein